MAALQITITDAGRAEIINATNTGTAPVLITEVGLGTGQYTPTASQTALTAETKRLTTIAGQVVADDTIHVTIKDETNDAYDVSEFGLFTASGTLFAVYSQATGPFMQKAAQSSLLLSVDVILGTLDATNLTFGDTSFSNPPASETVAGVIELATQAEALGGTDLLRAMTPKRVHEAFNQYGLGRNMRTFPAGYNGLPEDSSLLPTSFGYIPGFVHGGGGFALNVRYTDGIGGFRLSNTAYGDKWFLHSTNAADKTKFNAPVEIWHTGNHGPNSGLNADLLDGQHASYFLAATSYTAADVLAKLLSVDGAGSGVDADLLDGQHAAFFQDASNINAGTLDPARFTVTDRVAVLTGSASNGQTLPLPAGFTEAQCRFFWVAHYVQSNTSDDYANFGTTRALPSVASGTSFLKASYMVIGVK